MSDGIMQYIGARYVPAFYRNSDGNTDWRSGVEYEALTIVTYNGNSYTSRKPVPATVGDPSSNNEYWALTGVFNAQLGELIEKVDDLTEEVNTYSERIDEVSDVVGNAHGIWGIGRVNNPSNRHYLYYSADGKSFDFLRAMPANMDSDLSRVCHIGEWFYYVTSRGYQKSQDLVTWSDVQLLDVTLPIANAATWGTQFFEDVDGRIYMINAIQYQSGTIPLNAVGATTSPYFRIDCYEVVQDENGDLSTVDPSSPQVLLGGSGNTSYIDPFIVHSVEFGYVMCVKNEITCQVEIYNGASLGALTMVNINNNLMGTEGCQMVQNDMGDIVLYAHGYDPRLVSALDNASASAASCNRFPNVILRTRITCSWNQMGQTPANAFVPIMLWEKVEFPAAMRHPGFALCDADSYNIISKMHKMNVPDGNTKVYPNRQINNNAGGLVRFTNAPQDVGGRYTFTGANLQNITAEYVRVFKDPTPVFVTAQTGTAVINASSIALGTGLANAQAGRIFDLSALTDGGTITFYADTGYMLVPWKTA